MKNLHSILLWSTCCAAALTACSPPEPSATALAQASDTTAHVSDADATTHVKTALGKVPDLGDGDITVVTTKGDVRLAGTVASRAQMEAVITAARAAQGAHSIHNELTVRP